MPLTNTLVPIVLTNGLNQIVDSKVLQTALLQLENRVMTKAGRLDKRPGFRKLGNKTTTGTTITNGNLLSTFGDDLLLFDQDKLYSYVSSNDNWQSKGNLTTATVSSQAYVRTAGSQFAPDIAYLGGLVCIVWEEASGIRYSIFDDNSNSAIISDSLIDVSGKVPRVVALPTGFLILYLIGISTPYTITSIFIPKLNPSTVIANSPLDTAVLSQSFDVISYDQYAVYAYGNSGSTVTVGYLSTNGQRPVILPYPDSVSITDIPTSIGLAKDELNNSIYVALSTNSYVRLWRLESSLAGGAPGGNYNATPVTVDSVNYVRNIAPVFNNGLLKVFYEVGNVPSTSSINQLVKYASGVWYPNRSWSTSLIGVIERSVGLASKAFSSDVTAYVNTIFASNLQPTLFTIDETGQIIAKEQQGLSGLLSSSAVPALRTGVSSVAVDNFGRFIFAAQVRNKQTGETVDTISSTFGLNKLALNLNDFSYSTDVLGDNLIISGGIVSAYDGVKVAELGFNVYPEGVDYNTSSGALIGVYNYRVIYEWTDGKGQIHRSAPSITKTTASLSSRLVNIVVPTLRLSKKTGVKIVVYRSLAGLDDSVLYRVAEIANDPTIDVISIPDNTPDGTPPSGISSNEILYTTGGVLENIAPPAARVVHKHGSRMFLAGLENTNSFWFSKERVVQEGVSFNDGFVKQVDPTGGDISALGTLDDKLVIFKPAATFMMAGEGPVDTGAQDDFTLPQLIQGDVGSSSQSSQVITPEGLMFQTTKGIWLVSRSIAISYLGAPADDFKSVTVTSAKVLTDSNQVRFTTAQGTTIVYDYYFKQWYTFTNYKAVSAVVWKNNYLHLTANGIVNQDDATIYNDNGSKISSKIETSWIHPNGIQGFQRIKDILMLGEYNGAHTVSVKVAYDYEKVYNETVLFAADDVYASSYFGVGAYYGTLTPFGGIVPSAYQFLIKPARQKCEAFKLLIEDIDNAQGGGPAFSLSALSCWIGVKYNINKVPTIQAGGQ